MPSTTTPSDTTSIATVLALIEQFVSNLSPNASRQTTPALVDSPSPLLLLDASAKALKAQVTKLSLLTVTTPYTPSAIATCLRPLNDSVLPSLVTAALLTTPETFIEFFSNECRSLTRAILRELLALAKLVEKRSKDNEPSKELTVIEKQEITEATGRVWESCDEIIAFSFGGLPRFVVRKAKEWLDLMKDAVKELTEWDPEEEVDPYDIFGATDSDSGSSEDVTKDEKQDSTDRVTISAGVKDQALKVLSRIPQSIHVVVKQRLEKLEPGSDGNFSCSTKQTLSQLLKRIRNVSEFIDESAEGMYLGDLELCLKKAGEARAETIEIVESVLQYPEPMAGELAAKESQEDEYIKRALEWIRQVGPTSTNDTS